MTLAARTAPSCRQDKLTIASVVTPPRFSGEVPGEPGGGISRTLAAEETELVANRMADAMKTYRSIAKKEGMKDSNIDTA